MKNPFESGLLPWQLKVAYVLWIAVWIPAYCLHYDPRNLLWMCDTANIILVFALCYEVPILLSAQAVAVLLVQVAWSVDYFTALLWGSHPIGGTEYMFDKNYPQWMRAMSLFHVAVPPLLLWGLYRVGFDRRGIVLQTGFIWLLLPLTYVVADEVQNVNWLWAPFGIEQNFMSPELFLLVMMLAYPVIVFLPTHFLLARLFPPSTRPCHERAA